LLASRQWQRRQGQPQAWVEDVMTCRSLQRCKKAVEEANAAGKDSGGSARAAVLNLGSLAFLLLLILHFAVYILYTHIYWPWKGSQQTRQLLHSLIYSESSTRWHYLNHLNHLFRREQRIEIELFDLSSADEKNGANAITTWKISTRWELY
jgi:hypothetical protein